MRDIDNINKLVDKYHLSPELMTEIYYDIYHNMAQILTTEERIRILKEIEIILTKNKMNYFFEFDDQGELLSFYPNGVSPKLDYRTIFEEDTLRNKALLENPLYRGEYTIKPKDITEEEYEMLNDNQFNMNILRQLLIKKTMELFNSSLLAEERAEDKLLKYKELIESQKMYLSTCQFDQEQIIENYIWKSIKELELLKLHSAPNQIIDNIIKNIKNNKDKIRLYLPLRKDKIVESLPEYSNITLERCLFHDLGSFIYELKKCFSKNEIKKQLKKDNML